MPTDIEGSDYQINKIINFAQNLRKKIIIPNLQLENILNFQYAQITQKTALFCCTVDKASINKCFKRAFRTMNRLEQAHFYSKCVKFTLNQLHSINNNQNSQQENNQDSTNPDYRQSTNTKKFQQINILYKKQGSFKKWVQTKIQIATQIYVLRILQTGQQLDLNNYLIRESKSKNKPSLVLESCQQWAEPVTLRISNCQDTIQQLKKKLQFYLDKGLKKKISKALKKKRSSYTLSSEFRTSIKNIQSKEMDFKNPNYNNDNQHQKNKSKPVPATLQLAQGTQAKSMRKILHTLSSLQISVRQSKKIWNKLITYQQVSSLNTYKDFIQVQNHLYSNKKQLKTRKKFIFSSQEIDYQWLVTQMNCYKMFKRWKNSLFLVNLLAELPNQRTKIYHQINLYKDYTEVDYVFLRHLFQIDGTYYFIDKSINTQQYGSVTSNVSRGFIQYCLWRFKKINNQNEIEILVEIQLKNIKSKNMFQMSNQYIGDVQMLKSEYLKDMRANSMSMKTVKNENLFLFEDQSELNGRWEDNYFQLNRDINSNDLSFKKMDSRVQLIQQEINARKKSQQIKNQKEKQQKSRNYKYQKQKPIIKQPRKPSKEQNIQLPEFLKKQNLQKQNQEGPEEPEEPAQEYYNQKQTMFFSIGDQSDLQDDNLNLDLNQENNQQFSDCVEDEPSQSTQIQQNRKLVRKYSEAESNIFQKLKSLNDQNFGNYILAHHVIMPGPKSAEAKLQKSPIQGTHFLWRKQWKITQKGELININYEQTKVQSSVLKLVLKKMGRNLLSGKSILNISLPIEIFGTDSNLQRLCKGMAYGPKFLQQAANMESPVERMKRVMCFALGFGICYIQMQKPFNPILGQTYQGIIDGCPVYGQQISHHPPISTLFLKGRGYQAYGNFEAKVQMGMNSVSGINQGFMNISFNKKGIKTSLIKFTCPPGQVSGLVYGQRKLSLTRKSFYVDQQNMILGVIHWGSQKKKNQISFNNDYFEGKIIKLKQKIDLKKLDKIKQNNSDQILCNIKGRWTSKVTFDEQVLFDVENDAPYQVQQQKYPLLSNVNYRQDLQLRKQNKWNQAQQAKQRLQQLQREDRKLRKKYQKNH